MCWPERHGRLVGGSRLVYSRFWVHSPVEPSNFDSIIPGYRLILIISEDLFFS